MVKFKILDGPNKDCILKIVRDEYFDYSDQSQDVSWYLKHGRYSLLNNVDVDDSDCESWDDVKRVLLKSGAKVILPVYMYVHSGITIKTTPFSCRWDSGQVGFIYYTMKQIQFMWGWKKINRKRREYLLDALRESVKEYDNVITGQVYRFEIEKDDKIIDACNGFIGEPKDSCMSSYIGIDDFTPQHLEPLDQEAEYMI